MLRIAICDDDQTSLSTHKEITEKCFTVLPVEKDQTLQTTKQDGGLHGWGLKSARTAAEKYDGTIQTSYDNNIFRAVATLSYQCISTDET